MRLLALDLETTGFDFTKDRIIEIGYALWDTKQVLVTEAKYVFREDYPASNDNAARAHGITVETLKEFGQDPKSVFSSLFRSIGLWGVDYLVGHNLREFDWPFVLSEAKKEALTAPGVSLLDTKDDLPHDGVPDSNKLKYLAADAGFLNPFPHRALFDALTCIKLLEKFDIESVIRYSKIPTITIEARVKFDDREKAKLRKFFWEPGTKRWLKKIKETELESEKSQASFLIEVTK